ncbi:hypothetical protein LTR64_004002 [Lithohypha guttulata]|uniref:Uncharacterized protein n=1 Tax=Lithohypha guttulata TaxID=1690604 RepID=A0AAN7T7N6_9EURO|nr:hypothetical protein LTR51_006703 [Lithohypha guttulata]KAK5088917.1 hypothetical protein LTR05_003140 [Lithohypha guttulata]
MGRDTVSVVSNGDPSASTYATPEDAPPTYELATSDRNTIYTPPASEASYSTRASIPLGAESQSLGNDRHVSLSGRQELVPAGSSEVRVQGEPQIPIRPPFAPGKHYERHETSQPIHGTFTLHDSLDLSTTSGSIGISIDVMPGPYPATLKLKSTSGSINVTDKQYDVAQSRWGSRQNSSCGPRGPGPLSFLFGWARQRQDEVRTIEQPPIPSSDDPRKQAGQDGFPLPQQQDPEVEQVPRGARVIHTTIETSSGSVNAQLAQKPG